MGRARTLDEVSAALRGASAPHYDWTAVLDLANQSLVTPGLAAALAPVAERVPETARVFLAEVRRRNHERNHRLTSQLHDAVAALNAAGIEPVLLKGAALLATCEAPLDRLLSDLDLLVAPAQADAAVAALERAGFGVMNRYPGAAPHVVAELGRPQDVGLVDLHRRPPGPPGLAETPELAERRAAVAVGGGRAWIPDAASQILHLVLHDQFHDGDYWRGGFDLRHLADLKRLAPELVADDLTWLLGACGGDLVRGALRAQLLAADRLLGGAAAQGRTDARALWTYRRWRLQHVYPALRLPLALLAFVVEAPQVVAHRAANFLGRGRVLGAAAVDPVGPVERVARLRKIMAPAMGKI